MDESVQGSERERKKVKREVEREKLNNSTEPPGQNDGQKVPDSKAMVEVCNEMVRLESDGRKTVTMMGTPTEHSRNAAGCTSPTTRQKATAAGSKMKNAFNLIILLAACFASYISPPVNVSAQW